MPDNFVIGKSVCKSLIVVILVFFLLLSAQNNSYSYLTEKYYTIQVGCFMRPEGAKEQFDFFAQKLKERDLSYLRIEKGEKCNAVRLGKFEDMISARKALSAIKFLSPGAFLLRDTIEDKEIIRQYNRILLTQSQETKEKPSPEGKGGEVKVGVERASLKDGSKAENASIGKPMKEISGDNEKIKDHASAANSDDQWTLQRCIGYAIKNNPYLQSSEAKIQASTYYYDFQKKLFFPHLDLNASTGYLVGEPISAFATVQKFTEEAIRSRKKSGPYISAYLTLDIPVLKEGVLFTKNAPTINIAEKQIQMNKSTYEVKKNDLTSDISASFFNLLKNREEIKASEEHIKYLNVIHKIALAKYNENLISKSELLKAEVELASGEKGLETARNSSKKLMADLTVKMGLEPTKEIIISEEEFRPSVPPLDKLITIALSQRPEIKVQELQMSIAQESVREAKSQQYPKIDLLSNLGASNDYGSNSNSLWTGFLQLTMPIFDFGAIRSKIESKKAEVTEQEKLLLSIKGSVTQEVISVFTNTSNLKADVVLKEKMVEHSLENARLMRSRFEQNLVSLSSVLEAEYLLYADQKKLAQARYDLSIAYLQLMKATGSNITSSL